MAAEFIASDPNRFGKLTGWHTAGINVAGSFLLGGISATPTINVAKVNSHLPPTNDGASATTKALRQKFQGLSPRTKLMMGVGYVIYKCSTGIQRSMTRSNHHFKNLTFIGFSASFSSFMVILIFLDSVEGEYKKGWR
jgi:hypothetical protein